MRKDKRLRKKQLIVLDIGTNTTKVVVGKHSNSMLDIKEIFTITTPHNCLSNGQITDFEKLFNSLSEGLKEKNVKKGYVVVNFKSSYIINRELVLPSVPDNELESMVKYEILQYLPTTAKEYAIQFKVLEDVYVNEVKNTAVNVTAIDKSIVEGYLALVTDLGLKPYVLDVHFNTLSKFFGLTKDVDMHNTVNKTVAVIDLGYNSTDVSIFVNGNFQMNRTIDDGSKELEGMLKNEFKIDLDNSILVSGEKTDTGELLKDRVEEILDPLIGEIRSVLKFYISRDIDNSIDHIYITGGIANVEGLDKYLEEVVTIPVYTIENIEKVVKGIESKEDLSMYINAFGALIRL